MRQQRPKPALAEAPGNGQRQSSPDQSNCKENACDIAPAQMNAPDPQRPSPFVIPAFAHCCPGFWRVYHQKARQACGFGGRSAGGLGGSLAVLRRLNGLNRPILSWVSKRAVLALKPRATV